MRDEAMPHKQKASRPLQELQGLRLGFCESGQLAGQPCETEEAWSSTAESARDLVVSVDPQGTILSISRTVPPYTPEKVVGTNVYDYLQPDHQATLRKALQEVLETGETCNCRLVGPGVHGNASSYSVSIWPIKHAGKVVALTLIAADLDAQKELERSLREPPLCCPGLLDSIATGVGLATIEGKILECNEAMLQMTGHSKAEMGQISLKDLFAGADGHCEHPQRQRVDGVTRNSEVQLRHNGGGTRWVNLNILPFHYDGHDLLLTTLADITSQKTLDEAWRSSEEQYCDLVRKESDIIYSMDEEGTITAINQAVEATLGYRPQQLVGRKFTVLIPEILRKRAFANLQIALEEGELSGQTTFLDKNGQPHPAEYKCTVVKTNDGHLSLRGVARDISEKVETTHRMKLLTSAIEQSMDGMAITDLDSRLLYVNRAYARFHGHNPEDLLGLPIGALCAGEKTEEHKEHVRRIQRDGSFKGETRHIRKDGTDFLAYVSATSVKDEQGKPIAIISVLRDITESRKAEKELILYRDKMTRMERLASLGTFSATLAHELAQPLTVIRLAVENTLQALQAVSCANAPTLTEQLQSGLRAIENVTSITSQIRCFGRQSSQRAIEKVDLNRVAVDVIRLLERPARRSRVTLCLQDMDTLPAVLLSNDMEQVFFVLVENAIQAADGTNDHHVTIKGAVQNGHIELRFSDDCGGIPPKHLSRIFDPFFTTKPRRLGTGLGLPIAKRIVTKNEGKIWAENNFGEGVTFAVNFPIEPRGGP